MDTVVVAMSGGVDSSLAAALLHEQGFRVIGVTMKLWDYDSAGGNVNHDSGCCTVETTADARHVCDLLGVPHYVVDLRREFEKAVMDDFVEEYAQGRTPNPCVRCNTYIKWSSLIHKAAQLGSDLIATGHYARTNRSPDGLTHLLKGIDANKDQSYALWGLKPDAISRTLFPLGEFTKAKTRQMAQERNLKTANKKESQDICFVPDGDYGRFIREYAGEKVTSLPAFVPGPIENSDGEVLGQHTGTSNYTIGQRKGLGVATGEPQYVTGIYPDTSLITIGSPDDLMVDKLLAHKVNWTTGEPPKPDRTLTIKIRYNGSGQSGRVICDGSTMEVRFDAPARAVTPGQSVVIYDGDEVLGGGIIRSGIVNAVVNE